MTTLTYAAATAKGQKFPVTIVVSGQSTTVTIGGYRAKVVKENGAPIVKLSAEAALHLCGATLPDWKGALRLDRDFTHALAQAEDAELKKAIAARRAVYAAENPEQHALNVHFASLAAVMEQD